MGWRRRITKGAGRQDPHGAAKLGEYRLFAEAREIVRRRDSCAKGTIPPLEADGTGRRCRKNMNPIKRLAEPCGPTQEAGRREIKKPESHPERSTRADGVAFGDP